MTHKTKAIILRSIKYGEASLVVTAFTELFGIQTYLVNGVRASNKKTNNAACFQPSAILGMEVYHNELKKNASHQGIWVCTFIPKYFE